MLFVIMVVALLTNQAVFLICRSNRPGLFLGKSVLKICSKFTEEQPCQIVISIKLLKQLF